MEEALEALSTVIDVTVGCNNGQLCNTTETSTCTVEFLTELGDVPLISASVSNMDSLVITEYQASKSSNDTSFQRCSPVSVCTCNDAANQLVVSSSRTAAPEKQVVDDTQITNSSNIVQEMVPRAWEIGCQAR